MTVTVLFFGATAAVVGSREIGEAIDDQTSVRTLVDRVSKTHPRLLDHKLLVAVNEEYANLDSTLSDGDRVAIFTAVSGG